MVEVKKGDVIQITERIHSWYGCLLIVDEIKSWGVQAFLLVPQSNDHFEVKIAYTRLKNGSFEKIGSSKINN